MKESIFSDIRDIPESPKIETLRTPQGEISYSPERGGIITSMKLRSPEGLKEVLYVDQTTFDDSTKNVKGGIPILFPNAGPIESPDYPGMKQHGFARNMRNWESGMSENEFWERLTANPTTREQYPYNFLLEMRGKFESDSSMKLTQTVANHETQKTYNVENEKA